MKNRSVTRGWKPERRAAQAARARAQKPWLKSTGPRTEQGRKNSRMNAYKHGMRSECCREIKALLRRQAAFLENVRKYGRFAVLFGIENPCTSPRKPVSIRHLTKFTCGFEADILPLRCAALSPYHFDPQRYNRKKGELRL